MKGNDFSKIMETAQKLQDSMKNAQKELKDMRVTGEAGAGLVKITGNGRHDVTAVSLDPSLLNEEKEIIEDLIAAACNDLNRKIEKGYRDKMSGFKNDFNMPSDFDLSDLMGGNDKEDS